MYSKAFHGTHQILINVYSMFAKNSYLFVSYKRI